MKMFATLALSLGLLSAGSVNAAETFEETRKEASDKASSGMLLAALGSPAGTVAGALVGSGERTSQRTGSSKVKTVRSPNRRFVAGDQVEIRGNRLHPKSTNHSAALADANDGARSLR